MVMEEHDWAAAFKQLSVKIQVWIRKGALAALYDQAAQGLADKALQDLPLLPNVIGRGEYCAQKAIFGKDLLDIGDCAGVKVILLICHENADFIPIRTGHLSGDIRTASPFFSDHSLFFQAIQRRPHCLAADLVSFAKLLL